LKEEVLTSLGKVVVMACTTEVVGEGVPPVLDEDPPEVELVGVRSGPQPPVDPAAVISAAVHPSMPD